LGGFWRLVAGVLPPLLLLAGCHHGAPPPAPLAVFAAASLADAMGEVGQAWRQAGGGPVEFNFAGSSTLAQQIAAGAPADLFLSANWAQLERAGRSRPADRLELLGNSLVVVIPASAGGQPLSGPRQLLGFERLALADPEAVPAGVYARLWLEREGLWAQLSGRVVPALDVRAALASVASGSLPAGVVYATDAAGERRVTVVYRVPPERGPAVRYWAAPIADGPAPVAARDAFFTFLRSPAAGELFRRHGFQFLPGEA
jgi:molybdate transport system substrate-binding protein